MHVFIYYKISTQVALICDRQSTGHQGYKQTSDIVWAWIEFITYQLTQICKEKIRKQYGKGNKIDNQIGWWLEIRESFMVKVM